MYKALAAHSGKGFVVAVESGLHRQRKQPHGVCRMMLDIGWWWWRWCSDDDDGDDGVVADDETHSHFGCRLDVGELHHGFFVTAMLLCDRGLCVVGGDARTAILLATGTREPVEFYASEHAQRSLNLRRVVLIVCVCVRVRVSWDRFLCLCDPHIVVVVETP